MFGVLVGPFQSQQEVAAEGVVQTARISSNLELKERPEGYTTPNSTQRDMHIRPLVAGTLEDIV